MTKPRISTDYPWHSTPGPISLVATSMVVAILMTAVLFPGSAHNGQIAGNKAMALSAVLGAGGVWTVYLSHRWPSLTTAGRLLVVAGLGYIVIGALQGNGRWALLLWRVIGYAGTIGAAWLAEWILRDRRDDVTGFAGWAAAGIGLLVVRFEVLRAAERIWVLPTGQQVTDAWLARADAWRLWWTIGAGAVYAAIVIGVRLLIKRNVNPSLRKG